MAGRRCQVVAPCCQRVYTCRHCHDEAEDHRLQGSDVTTMVCMDCGLRQPAAGAFIPRLLLHSCLCACALTC